MFLRPPRTANRFATNGQLLEFRTSIGLREWKDAENGTYESPKASGGRDAITNKACQDLAGTRRPDRWVRRFHPVQKIAASVSASAGT